MDYTIRKALPEDMTEIINLCEEHAAYEQASYNRPGKAEKLSFHLFSKEPRLFCLIAEQNSSIAGYATYMFEFSTWDAAFYCHMDCLYLRPAYRGFGMGEALVHEIEKQAKLSGIDLIQWQTPVSNVRAIKFYHRIGATSKEKLRLYYRCKQ